MKGANGRARPAARNILAAAFLLAAGGAQAAGPSIDGGARARPYDHSVTCKHYENRARFKPRAGDVEFVVVLAESCRLALDMTVPEASAPPELARTAATFLERLTRFRATIIEMNLTRLYGKNPQPRSMPLNTRGPRSRGTGSLGTSVSATGEYLIAYRMGVTRALRDWVRSGAQVAVALR